MARRAEYYVRAGRSPLTAYVLKTVQLNDSPLEVFTFAPGGKGPHAGIAIAQHIPPVEHGGDERRRPFSTASRVPLQFQ
jgi:hypothetical protein